MWTLTKAFGSKDFLAGAIFLLIGGSMVAIASDYPFGSLLRMGPGFFPIIIGSLLALVGIVLMGKSIFTQTTDRPRFHLRPAFFITTAILSFAYLLPRLGLAAATVFLVIIMRLAFRPVHPMGALVLSAILAAIATIIFSYVLRLPLKLWP